MVNWSDSKDSFEVDLEVTVPGSEPPGEKYSNMTFVGSLGE